MSSPRVDPLTTAAKDVLEAFDSVNGGLHPGFRPAHAKGILLTGVFTPAPMARFLSGAPHLERASTPVSVRFSDFAGIPAVPDTDPNASPRGIAIRFHLAEHVHTDIIAHSVDGFPARTVEEFTEFLRAVAASSVSTEHPSPIERFLGEHPAALEFVQAPKPIPVSFAKNTYFGVSAYRFVAKDGASQYGRYRVCGDGDDEYLDAEAAARQSPDFLFDEIRQRLARGPVRMHVAVQIAAEGDVVNDSTVHWPQERAETEFGTIEIQSEAPNDEAEQRHIIFDPIPRVEGIEPSDDPLLDARASTYLASGRRRRANAPK
jgi:catalase